MKKKIQIPHIFVILVCIAMFFAVLSWIMPAGAYDRVLDPNTGRNIVDPNSFHYLPKTPITFIQFISAYSGGFTNAASMIFMTLVVGGTFGIINELGIIPAALAIILKKFDKNWEMAIPFLILVFGLFESFMGAPELCIIFLPMILPLVLDLGFDTMTALAIVICGNCVGYSTGMGNPFTTIIGQKICQLPLYSAMWYRAICFFLFYGITVWYILRYAKKIRKNPILSATYEEDEIRRKENMQMTQNATLSAKNKVVCVYVVVCFFFNIFGVIKLGWDIAEMTGLFLVMSTGAGVFSGHSLTDTCKMFMNGARDILQGALVMCFARTIALLMTTSNTLDVFVYGISKIAGAFPPTLAIVGIFIAGMLLNFPINSGSGQMTATMPIMSPLADILHVSKQGAVLATQFGDGWSNTIYPTNASYMATMAVAKVNWVDWLKFQFPLHCIWTVVSVSMLIIAQTINIGPF